MSLLALCEALHMVASGVADGCMRHSEVERSLNDLRVKLKAWKPSPSFTKRYDDCVKALVEATLAEWEQLWSER